MTNPFSTKFWTAGTLPFRFPEETQNIDTLLEQFQQYRMCQIVGPHGSGKSTLLSWIAKRLEQRGEGVQCLLFNEQHRQIPRDVVFSQDILLVDGFEQLQLLDRVRLFFGAKRMLLIVHRPIWFVPILFRTQPQFAVFEQIVQQLQPDVSEEYLRAVYVRSGGNFRSAFFELYDYWEEQNRRASS
ncbi:MAG: hypothetical protein FWG73_03770 [Planctomycetaceae bacterium]|nr:hypothetical protein [Planctomycetaceae bacterium]